METVKGNNSVSIKQNNRTILLNIIKQNEGVSRSQLSKLTHLTKGGITPIISGLIELDLIKESGITNTDSGRKPTLIKINPDGLYVIALDFTREGFSSGLVDFSGEIVSFKIVDFSIDDSLHSILELMKQTVQRLLTTNAAKRIIGICIVAPGPLNYLRGIIHSPPNFHGWKNIPIKSILEQAFHLPVFLDNDANAYAYAEKCYGFGRNYSDFIHVTVDQGIGCGMIIDGKIYRGHGGFGSEIGHTTINMNGPKCECGNNGCLELYASIPNIVKAAGKPWIEIIQGLKEKESESLEIIEREAFFLGHALITLINILEPKAIVLGGRLAEVGKHLLEPLKRFVEEKTMNRKFQMPQIYISEMSKASIIGGATIVMDSFIQGDLGTYEDMVRGRGVLHEA